MAHEIWQSDVWQAVKSAFLAYWARSRVDAGNITQLSLPPEYLRDPSGVVGQTVYLGSPINFRLWFV